MRVLLNALQAGNRSGTGRYTTELVRHLAAGEDDMQFVAAWPAALPHPEVSSTQGLFFLDVDTRGHFKRIAFDQLSITRHALHAEADAVHFPANIGRLLPLKNMVLTVHDLSFVRHPEWFRRNRALYYRHAAKRSVALATRVIADSQSTADDLMEFFATPSEKIDVIPLGIDSSFRPATEEQQAGVLKKYRLPQDFFLFMATIEPRKNIERLVEAWARIACTCSFDLVIAGRQGWKVKDIMQCASGSPHGDRIHWPGFIDDEDQAPLLSAARAFVWPALWEGFGLPPLEAMACGTPVLTSNVSSLPEAVGEAALMVDPTDTEAIAEGMLALAESSDLRGELAAKGLAHAADFTWQRTAALTRETYRRVSG